MKKLVLILAVMLVSFSIQAQSVKVDVNLNKVYNLQEHLKANPQAVMPYSEILDKNITNGYRPSGSLSNVYHHKTMTPEEISKSADAFTKKAINQLKENGIEIPQYKLKKKRK